MIYDFWKELLPLLAKALKEVADLLTDPPDEYAGLRQTAAGNEYTIRKIPSGFPFAFSITIDVPGEGTVVFVRADRFDSAPGMERLIAHEERHVDQWANLGWPEFVAKYASHGGRLKLEADGYCENVHWKMLNDPSDPPVGGLDRLSFWLLYYAGKIDQAYHIRGHGIKDAYNELANLASARYGYAFAPWDDVAQYRAEFKPVPDLG